MHKKKASLLMEVIVSSVLVILLASLAVPAVIFISRSNADMNYRLTAVNLAREVIEFGEGTSYLKGKLYTVCWVNRIECKSKDNNGLHTHCGQCCCPAGFEGYLSYRMRYHYYPEKGKYAFIYRGGKNDDFEWLGYVKIGRLESSAENHTESAQTSDPPVADINPFINMGDIEKKNMAPLFYPDSVEIVYDVALSEDYNFSQEYWNILRQALKARIHNVSVKWKGLGGKEHKVTLTCIPVNKVNDTYKLSIGGLKWRRE